MLARCTAEQSEVFQIGIYGSNDILSVQKGNYLAGWQALNSEQGEVSQI